MRGGQRMECVGSSAEHGCYDRVGSSAQHGCYIKFDLEQFCIRGRVVVLASNLGQI
jgi:hypothetical protein